MCQRRALVECLALLLLCGALFLPGLAVLPPVDRDEALYAQAARQMIEAGDWVVPRVGDEARLLKPIGIYWLQIAAVRLTGWQMPDSMVAHRLPSALGAILAVLGTWWIGRGWFAPPVPLIAAALLACSALLVVEAHLATTDAVLLACIVVSQGCLARLFMTVRRGKAGSVAAAIGFWLALSAGTLLKGPVAPLVSALTLAVLIVLPAPKPKNRSRSRGEAVAAEGCCGFWAAGGRRTWALVGALRPGRGVLLILVCVLPWVVALGSAVGWRSLPEAMLSDMVPKLTGVQESHAGFPGYYLLLAPVTFWPSSLFLLVALLHGWKHRQRPAERFLLAWLVPTWLLFELVPTKLPHYVLPTFPALALLAGRGVCAAPATLQPLLQRPAVRTALCAWGLILVVITVAVLIGVRHLDATALAYAGAVIGVVVGVGTGGACMMLVWRNSLRCAVVVGATGAALLFAVLLGTVLPGLDALWLSRRIASVAEAISPRRGWLAVGYAEPSLMLLARVPVRRTELEAAVDALEGPEPPLVLVSDSHREAFLGAVRRRGLRPRQRGSVMGFDYTHGRWITVELFGAE